MREGAIGDCASGPTGLTLATADTFALTPAGERHDGWRILQERWFFYLHLNPSKGSCRRILKFLEGVCLDLADSFRGNAKLGGDGLDHGGFVGEMPRLNNAPLAIVESTERFLQR